MAAKKGTRPVLVNLPPPPVKELAAIGARAAAAGKKPSQAAILATYARNQARPAPKPQGRSAGGSFAAVSKAPTSKPKVPTRGAFDQIAGLLGPAVEANARKIADVGRYALPGSERQLFEAVGRAFEGAIPGRIRKPPADSRETVEAEKAYRRRFEQTGSTRPPYHLTAADFQRLTPEERAYLQQRGGIRIMR